MSHKTVNQDFPTVRTHAAGIDVGAKFHVVAIPENLSDNPVRQFPPLTSGLQELVAFLKEHGITEAAMEATGVYWEPLYDILEKNGIKPFLLNPRSLKGLPKKSDVLDCQWILKVFSHGFGTTCFVPDAETLGLRELVRARASVVEDAAQKINRMIKILRLMNINLEMAVTDIQGETGMRIIAAIIDGERDPKKLAALRDCRCKQSEREIAEHLNGVFSECHIFNLASNFRTHAHLLATLDEHDERILSYLRGMASAEGFDENDQAPPVPSERGAGMSRTTRERRTDALFAQEARRILGVDLSLVEGIGAKTILVYLSEVGKSVDAFENAGRLASYLGLCPACDISGGKKLSQKTKKVSHRLALALRMAALSLIRSKSWLGAYLRKMRARQGTPKALTTTAHKLLRLIFGLVQNGKDYVTKAIEEEEAKVTEYRLRKLTKTARELGVELYVDGQPLA